MSATVDKDGKVLSASGSGTVPILHGVWDGGIVPFGQAGIELDRHFFLEVQGVLATFLINLVQNADDDFGSLSGHRFFDAVVGRGDNC